MDIEQELQKVISALCNENEQLLKYKQAFERVYNYIGTYDITEGYSRALEHIIEEIKFIKEELSI